MAPNKDFRDTIKNAGGKVKSFFSSAADKIKDVFSGASNQVKKAADKNVRKIKRPTPVSSGNQEIPPKPVKTRTYVPKAKARPEKPAAKQPAQNKPLQKKSPGTPVSDETVIFSEPVGKKIKTAATPLKEQTQPIPVTGNKKSIFKPRDKKPNFVLGVILTTIKFTFVAVIIAAIIGVGSLMGVANAYLDTTPELDVEKIQDQSLSSKIYYQDGDTTKLLATYTGSENRDYAALEDIPEDLRNAVIAVEDIRFYDHNGVDFRRLVGAFLSNMSSSKVEGGSTITQQLVKNKLLSNERSYKRKLQEAYLATELEKKYSKDEILEAYLNAIPLGGTVYGVKTAAKDYFGKDLSELNLREMILIASITQNPTKYNPRLATYTYPEHLPDLINRMNIVAERMYWAGMITEEEYNEVTIPSADYLAPECLAPGYEGDKILKDGYLDTWKEMMQVQPESPANELYQYPHFVEYVVHDVQTFLLEKEGLEDTEANRAKVDREMRAGGYEIYTTLNPTIQETVQNTLADYDGYPTLPKNVSTEITDSSGIVTQQPQAAAAVIDNETGYLVAIVGSRDTPTIRRSINRANEGLQVGSSMKPIAVYGPAFDIGYGPVSPVAYIDAPITGWLVKDGSEGAPAIQSGAEQGPIEMRTAVVKSLNVAAARTLMDYVTIDTSVEYLHKLGIPDENITPTGVGLALGGSEVTPIQMTAAYAAIANEGEYRQPVSFTQVRDANKNVIIDTTTDRDVHEAFKPSTAYMLTDVLEQAVREGTGNEARLDGITTAGKTGTVGDHKGVTFAGYTPYYTSMVWVGHDQNKSIGRYYGGGVAAPLWKEYMQKIHEGLPDKPIIEGEPSAFNINTNATVCQYTGLKPGSGCPTFTGWMLSGTEPTEVCSGYHSVSEIKMCGVSGMRFIEGVCPEESAYTIKQYSFPSDSPYSRWSGAGSMIATTPEMAEGAATYSSGGDPNTECNVHFPGWDLPSESPSPSETPVPTVTPAPTPSVAPEPSPSQDPQPAG